MELLDGEYVNTWVLAKDLGRMGETTDDEHLAALCALLKEHYTYPVDSVLVSPEVEEIGQMDSLAAARGGPREYLKMLSAAIGAAGEDG